MDSEVARSRAEGILAAWNRRDYDAVADNVSPHVVLVDHIRGRKADGPAGYVGRFRPTLDAFEDMQGETVSLIVEGNQHIATHMEVDEDGKPTTIRTYGTRDEIPLIAHATGVG